MGSRPLKLDLTCVEDGFSLSGFHRSFWVRGFTFLSTLTFVHSGSMSLNSRANFGVPCDGKCDKRGVPNLRVLFPPASTVIFTTTFLYAYLTKSRNTASCHHFGKMKDSTVAKEYGMMDHWRSLLSCSLVASTAFLYGWETINFDTLQAMPGFLQVRSDLPTHFHCPKRREITP